MAHRDRTADRVIAGLAYDHNGVVTRRALVPAGVTVAEIRHRLRVGALWLEYPGVYRVGHRAPSVAARYSAAVLACGDRAFLTGRAGAHLLGLLRGVKVPPPAEVTAPTERRIPGLRTRRMRDVDPRHVSTSHRVRVATVPFILVDLAADLAEEDLILACHEAQVRYETTPAQVEAVLARRSNARNARTLRRIMSGEVRVSLSALERRALEHLRDARLRLPDTNRKVGNHRVDLHWDDPPLTVELDGYRFHNSRHAWQQGHERARAAYARGEDFRVYTHDDVFVDPRRMLAELRSLVPRG